MLPWTFTFCIVGLSTLIPASHADPLRSDDRSPPPGPAAVREGAVMFPRDRMKQEDVVALKDLMKNSISNLQELVEEEIAHVNVRITKGLDRLNEQLEEGDDHLKEEIDEDISRMKERMTKGLNYVKELLIDGDEEMNEKLSKLKEAFGKGLCDDGQSVNAMMSCFRQITELKTELNSTKHQLYATQTELKTHQETLQSTHVDLNITKVSLQSTQETLHSIRVELNTTQETLQSTLADLNSTRQSLKSTQETLQSTRADLVIIKTSLQSTREQLHEEHQTSTELRAQLKQEISSLKVRMDSVQSSYGALSSEMGSTFTRWGRTTCPDNTALVYSGYVGGQHYTKSGGGSNYLCLVRDPQLDNMTLPAHYNYLYGGEYQYIEGHNDQDAVCSVCRAPQVTTLMIPATLSCPPGWTTQYRGHLVSGHWSHNGRTEFVCLDQVREHREGGEASVNAVLFYHVVTQCGSLPCSPYTNNTVVTCVVCSQ